MRELSVPTPKGHDDIIKIIVIQIELNTYSFNFKQLLLKSPISLQQHNAKKIFKK